jgi:hypothetical protein
MDDLATGGLDDATHDVDGSIVSVEQGGCCYNANFMLRQVWAYGFHAKIYAVKLRNFSR